MHKLEEVIKRIADLKKDVELYKNKSRQLAKAAQRREQKVNHHAENIGNQKKGILSFLSGETRRAKT